MSKLVVDQIQKSGGPALTLPTVDGTAGQALLTNGNGTLSFGSSSTPTSLGINQQSKVVWSYDRDSAVASAKVMWSDFGITDYTKVELVEVLYSNIGSSSGGFKMNMIGQTSSATDISSGYMAGTYFYAYQSGNYSSSQTSNSNNGNIFVPIWTSVYSSYDDSYGYTMTGETQLTPKKNGTYGFNIRNQVSWQYSSNTYPAMEMSSWDNYDTSAPPADWYGIRFYLTSGNFRTGSIVVRVTYRA
jgi:hypothetical protein